MATPAWRICYLPKSFKKDRDIRLSDLISYKPLLSTLCILHWLYLQLCFILNAYVTTLTIAFGSFLAKALRLFTGTGQSSRALYDFMTDHKKHCIATRWFCLHILLKMHNSSSLLCWLCCRRCGWFHPAEARKTSWDSWSALSYTSKENCQNWNTSSIIQDCKTCVLWTLILTFYNPKYK